MPWGSRGGTLPGPAGGGTLPGPAGGGVPWPGGYPGGVPWPGGYPDWGGVPWPGGYPGRGGTLAGGGTQLAQHREYLLHGGRYASCVHAGGLSCLCLQLNHSWLTVKKIVTNSKCEQGFTITSAIHSAQTNNKKKCPSLISQCATCNNQKGHYNGKHSKVEAFSRYPVKHDIVRSRFWTPAQLQHEENTLKRTGTISGE